jgi:D-glycero-alpha-D-manno-heptose-7-phosphate kinase
MILTRTPFRISFFGGGTDYHTWYQEHGGAVLSTTINHYCNILLSYRAPFFDSRYRFTWSKIEDINNFNDIQHPAIRAIMKYMDVKRGMEMHHKGDLPARSGLASSSAFTVGLIHAVHALRGRMCTDHELACEAIHVERDLLKENVGVQDQIATAYGGFNKITIHPDCTFAVDRLTTTDRIRQLNDHLLLFFTGVSRFASTIAGDKMKNMGDKARQLHTMRDMVDEAVGILNGNGDITDFGRMLHETWMLKKQLASSVSTDFIDDIYQRAMKSGALGGKILGAGGGGFILFFAKPEDQPRLLESLSDLLLIPFSFENRGSHVALYEPNQFSETSLMRQDFAHLKNNRNMENLLELASSDDDRRYRARKVTKIPVVQ